MAAVLVGISPSAKSPTTTGWTKSDSNLVLFGLCLKGLPVDSQIKLSLASGFSRLALDRFDTAQLAQLERSPFLIRKQFRVDAAMWWNDLNQEIDPTWLDTALIRSHRLGITVWMVAVGRKSDPRAFERALERYSQVAQACRKMEVPLVIYPHAGRVLETVEETLPMLDSLRARGFPEVRTSFHLCHELKAGNEFRIAQILSRALPRLGMVSISGASPGLLSYTHAGWDRLIQPLDRGVYDLEAFGRILDSVDYRGPMVLHTFGLPVPGGQDYDDHLRRSKSVWSALHRKISD